MSRRNAQSGVALITAILVVAIASIAAATVLGSAHVAIRRTALLQDSESASWIARGLESWIENLLRQDAANGKEDHLGEMWAQAEEMGCLPVDQGQACGGIVDLQGRFNLNNLATQNPKPYEEQFARLLQTLQISSVSPADITAAIRDWLDADANPGFPGAEDNVYLGLTPPYRAANRLMSSPSELMAVQGVTQELYQALTTRCRIKPDSPGESCITALPVKVNAPTPVNVNTASLELLMSLSANVDRPYLERFFADRAVTYATDAQSFYQSAGLGADIQPSMLSVGTQYFQIRGAIEVGSSRVPLYSLLHRPAQGRPVVLDHGMEE